MEYLTFNGTKDFYISSALNYNWPQGKTYVIQFFNNELDIIGEKLGLNFHYEFQYSEEKAVIRFDCHPKKYRYYKGINDEESYRTLIGEERFKIRDRLYCLFNEVFSKNGEYFISKKRYNYSNLFKKCLEKDYDLQYYLEQSEKFINDTYDKALELIKQVILENIDIL